MICEQHRCIFVHIPKAAGQSIEQFFMQRRGLVWGADQAALYLHENDDPSRGTEKLSHLSASEYVDCGHISAEDFYSYLKFSFVRNPWSRLLSEYLYRNYFHHRSFKHFVMEKQPTPGWCDKYRHVMPQYDMLHDSNGKLIVDYVGRFENLQADFSEVCKRLGITDSALPHRNSSDKESRVRKRRIRNTILRNGENRKKTLHDFYDLELRGGLTTGTTADAQLFPQRAGHYMQSFTGRTPEELWKLHLQAEHDISTHDHIQPPDTARGFAEAILSGMGAQMAYVRSLWLWPLRIPWWFMRRHRHHNKTIAQRMRW